jgi:hypothetical protein
MTLPVTVVKDGSTKSSLVIDDPIVMVPTHHQKPPLNIMHEWMERKSSDFASIHYWALGGIHATYLLMSYMHRIDTVSMV